MRILPVLLFPATLVFACGGEGETPAATPVDPTVDLLAAFPPLNPERPEPCDTGELADTDEDPCD